MYPDEPDYPYVVPVQIVDGPLDEFGEDDDEDEIVNPDGRENYPKYSDKE